jgi:D-cysteine desulfhydrase
MSNIDYLLERFPTLGKRLPRMRLASLPTPVREVAVQLDSGERKLSVKYDDQTGVIYGGNKVRKLEYIFPRARDKKCGRLATFGAVGSNSALATALYARQAGFDCTCFLMHQAKTEQIPATLNMHIQNGTELVRYGGAYNKRVQTLRDNLWGRHAWVIPMGGSSWRGTVGFVAAGLELAEQVAAGEIPRPDRIYVGTGTMGTAVGMALGLAIAEFDTEVHAVRASVTEITNEHLMQNLADKTVNCETVFSARATRIRRRKRKTPLHSRMSSSISNWNRPTRAKRWQRCSRTCRNREARHSIVFFGIPITRCR